MNNEIKDLIIKKLLQIISEYQNDDLSKEAILFTKPDNNGVVIYHLITKGNSFIGTPFRVSSTDTIIVEEFYDKFGDVVHANCLYSEWENKEF